MPPSQSAAWLGEPDDRIHKAPPSDDRAERRVAARITHIAGGNAMNADTHASPYTITLYVVSNTILPVAEPRWYVCTEKPYRYETYRLDAPWLYAGGEDGARGYARALVYAYRNHPRIRYEVADFPDEEEPYRLEPGARRHRRGPPAMNADTPITIQIDAGEQIATTWAAFVADNDADTVADVAEQIAADNYAEIGGGAAPVVWVFA